MARPGARRIAGWIILGVLAGVGVVGAVLGAWSVVGAVFVVLVAADAAMTFDQRARAARAVQITRAVHRDQQRSAASLAKLSKGMAAWKEAVELMREHDRRVLGVIETARIAAEDRSESLERGLDAVGHLLAREGVPSDADSVGGAR